MILPATFNQGLARVAHSQQLSQSNADLIVHGLHGSPLRALAPARQSLFWTAGDLSSPRQGDRHGKAGTAELGYGYRASETLQLNLAVGRSYGMVSTDQGGRTAARGSYTMPELIVALPGALYVTVSGYYARGALNIERGYLNAGWREQTSARPSVQGRGARLRLDWQDAAAWEHGGLTPYASLTRLDTRTASYTERGGGFPANWHARQDRV
ncbi:autotransporter domain-containing protein, partial [Ralstonia pseudosolanacearum]|uniref:autotransporter domain-containing protein n=1 Tax=Ralstonia pseudosolanacearum TaxID=1310165 RepID=UPI003D278BBD